MEQVILFTTHCPRCKALELKLNKKNIKFEESEDINAMLSAGLKSAPGLSVNGKMMDFTAAVQWINSQED